MSDGHGPGFGAPRQGFPPPPPEGGAWKVTESLRRPLWARPQSWRDRSAARSEVSLAGGVRIEQGFHDPERLLDTAYEDLRSFLRSGGVPLHGEYTIRAVGSATGVPESFRVEVDDRVCLISAGDTEGIRRAIAHVEDAMLQSGGRFLPRGVVQRSPLIRVRIVKNPLSLDKIPPLNLDELCDDVDYYPDEYLGRLAHEGVNGVWLRVFFEELCRTSVTPENGADAPRRLAKLRSMVEKCRRYGVKVYAFCIEPRAWVKDSPVLARHPELGRGGESWDGRRLFCPFSETAERYLTEATRVLFESVPGLGGLIDISLGERATTCLSGILAGHSSPCPVCSHKEPWEILHASLSAMERGMHAVDPGALFVSWLYLPQEKIRDWTLELASHTPPGVTLQLNLDSGVTREDFGKVRTGGDYWQSTAGPSERFRLFARAAREAGTPVSAKIQTGCSHETGSVPLVPVPGQLYRMFAGMRELGVTASMLSWQFGNYPGLMYRAAGRLAFEPFPESEGAFLESLARRDWGEHSSRVAEAWRLFAEGFAHYPLLVVFQYYGPMHDGVSWRLALEPEDSPLCPNWLLRSPYDGRTLPPSGDRIGECLHYVYTLEEAEELCRRMAETWDRGLAILDDLEPSHGDDEERRLDTGVARALGIHFRSGWSILRFYGLRERMLRMEGPGRLELLSELESIVEAEIERSTAMVGLCERDPRLGFNASADGYKYYPAKLRWRIDCLREVLARDFPRFELAIRQGAPLCPEYTGQTPQGPLARAPLIRSITAYWRDPAAALPEGAAWESCAVPGKDGHRTVWAACRDAEALYLIVRCERADHEALSPSERRSWRPAVEVRVEPRRLWPCMRFPVEASAERSSGAGNGWSYDLRRYDVQPGELSGLGDFEWKTISTQSASWFVLRLPIEHLDIDPDRPAPVRMNVRGSDGAAWIEEHPWPRRLAQTQDNPADLGWLLIDGVR